MTMSPSKRRRNKITCQIDENEARALQRLVLDFKGPSEVLYEGLDAILAFTTIAIHELRW